MAGPENNESADAVNEASAEASADGADNSPLALAKKEAAANHDRYLRAVADMENFRRRTVREKDELRQFASSRLLEDLIPVMDTLSMGVAAARQPGANVGSVAGGVEMVMTQFRSALSNHGLKEINPVGQPFDAHQQESISAQPSDKIPEGSVLEVVRPGYLLNGRLLRPASVVLSSGPAARG